MVWPRKIVVSMQPSNKISKEWFKSQQKMVSEGFFGFEILQTALTLASFV